MTYFLSFGEWLLSFVFGSDSEPQGSDEALKEEQAGWDWGFLEGL